MNNFLRSPVAQWVLKFALSKAGVVVSSLAAQLAAHAGVYLANFVAQDQLAQITGGLEQGAIILGNTLLAIIYAWVVHEQTKGTLILKTQLERSDPMTPLLDMKSGAIGESTLKAAAIVTGVPVQEAAIVAGVALKPGPLEKPTEK